MKDKKQTIKRQVRSYKILDKFYFAAQKIASKEKTTVGNVVENFLIDYSKLKK